MGGQQTTGYGKQNGWRYQTIGSCGEVAILKMAICNDGC